MSCLFCKYFQAAEPEDHKQAREAGTCPDGCSRNEWSHYSAANYVKHHKKYIGGWCRFDPEPHSVRCNGVCSKVELTWGRFKPPKADENLYEWAQGIMQEYLYGTWMEQEYDRLKEQNKQLRASLKLSRARAAKRLDRVKQLEAKPPQPTAEVIPFQDAAE